MSKGEGVTAPQLYRGRAAVEAMQWTGDNKSEIERWAQGVMGVSLSHWPVYSIGHWLLLAEVRQGKGTAWLYLTLDDSAFRAFFEPRPTEIRGDR